MAKDRFHFDGRGRLKGFSTDKSPFDGCGQYLLILAALFLLACWSCGG